MKEMIIVQGSRRVTYGFCNAAQSEAASISSAASSAAAPLAGRAEAPLSSSVTWSAHAHSPHVAEFCVMQGLFVPATSQQYSFDGKKHRPVVLTGKVPGEGELVSVHAIWGTGASGPFVGAGAFVGSGVGVGGGVGSPSLQSPSW